MLSEYIRQRASELAFHIENMAGPTRGRQDPPKGGIRRKDIIVITVEPNDRIFPGQDHTVRIYSAHGGCLQAVLDVL